MYYAQMFEYGSDQAHVGVTGIAGCMGVVFAAPNRLYAVHIPPNDPAVNLIGANAFVAMVQGGEGALHPGGSLHVFVNGMLRPTVDDETRHICDALGTPATTRIYRLFAGLTPPIDSVNPLSATIKVQRGAGALQLGYKHVPDNQWIQGGNARSGRYRGVLADDPTRPNNGELAAAWNQMTNPNCFIVRVH